MKTDIAAYVEETFSFKSYQRYLSLEDRQSFQILAGLVSIFLGILIAGAILYFLPVDMSSLEKAQALGIINRTTIDGYPKALETRYYVLGVSISLLSGLFLFLAITYAAYRRERRMPDRAIVQAHEPEKPKPRMGLLQWGILILALFLCTFYVDFIYKNWYWAWWGFFFEEGIYFRWINDLLRGRILYKDIYFYGGPFMIWPQYWLMKLLGPTIALNRYYVYFSYFAGYLIVFKVLRAAVRKKIFMFVGMMLILYLYHPIFPGFHQSLGRFAVSLIPVYLLYRYFLQKRPLYLFFCGISVGFALFFSQELGAGSLVALAAMLAAYLYREKENRLKSLFQQASLICAGALTVVVPVLGYFFMHHALGDFYEVVVNSPRYYMLGVWGHRFPNFLEIVQHPFTSHYRKFPPHLRSNDMGEYDTVEILLAYFPILFYIGSVFFFLALFLRKSYTNRHILLFGTAVLGGMIFQRAFGIYYLFQIRTVIYPLIILSAAFLDMGWPRLRLLMEEKSLSGRKLEAGIYAALLAVIVFSLFHYCSWRGYYPPAAPPYIYRPTRKMSNRGYFSLHLPRAQNVYAPPEEAAKINLVVDYLRKQTKPDEPIYIFPFSPMYYFLADRLSPVKYPVAHTLTKKEREEVIQKLEQEKVNVIIYTYQNPIQGVPNEVRYPEISEYILEHYDVAKQVGSTAILTRKENL